MKEKIVDFIYRYFLPIFGFFITKILFSTYKIEVHSNIEKNEPGNEYTPSIYACWHQRFFPCIPIFAKKKPLAAIISQSRDGEIVSRVASIMGLRPVRGSSSKDGAKALKSIVSMALSGYKVAHAVDGPRGPFGVVKPGIIRIAQLTHGSIIPVIMSCKENWTFDSWDRFIVPKPFSKVRIKFANSLKIPRHMDKMEFEKNRLKLEQKMKLLHQNEDSLWSD